MRVWTKSISLLALTALAVGCQTAPKTQSDKDMLKGDADNTLTAMYAKDKSLKSFIDASAGYAVFPSIGKGGLVFSGSYGRGIVYSGGAMVGYADVTKANFGATIGAQTYTEVVVFQNAATLQNFKSGKFTLTADASAVAVNDGTAASAKYAGGVAVFSDSKGGLMADASVGGQEFTFVPSTN